jgi:hypothetical protein
MLRTREGVKFVASSISMSVKATELDSHRFCAPPDWYATIELQVSNLDARFGVGGRFAAG